MFANRNNKEKGSRNDKRDNLILLVDDGTEIITKYKLVSIVLVICNPFVT